MNYTNDYEKTNTNRILGAGNMPNLYSATTGYGYEFLYTSKAISKAYKASSGPNR